MRKYLIFISFILGYNLRVFSQETAISIFNEETYMENLRRNLMGVEYQNPVEWYKGEQFFNIWTPGTIVFNDGKVVDGVYLQYEKFLDEVLWLREDFKIGILNKSLVSEFILFSKSGEQIADFVKIRSIMPFEKDTTCHYLQLLESGEISLYAYRNVKKSSGKLLLVSNTKYLAGRKDKLELVKLNKSRIFQIPGTDKERMKEILKTNHIKVKGNESEFARALNIYNQQQ